MMRIRLGVYAAYYAVLCVGGVEGQALQELLALHGGPLENPAARYRANRRAVITMDPTELGGIQCDIWSPGLTFPFLHDTQQLSARGHVHVYNAPQELVTALHHAENAIT